MRDERPNPDDSVASRQAAYNGRKLFALGAGATGAVLSYYALVSDVDDPFHLQQALLILFLAVLPCLLWALRGGGQIPAFEVLILTTANAYALPLLNGHVQLANYPTDIITKSANLVLLYQIVAIATHELVKARAIRSALFSEEILNRDLQKYLSYGLLLSTGYVFTSTYYSDLIPFELSSILRAVFFGIGLVTTFAQSRQWGQGTLGKPQRTLLIVMVTITALLHFVTLFLVQGMSIVMVALIGYVSGSRRLPVVATLALFTVTAVLHNGKSTMRARYWEDAGTRRTPTVQQMPGFYLEWIDASLAKPSDEVSPEMTKKLFDRTSLFHILCLVTFITPDQQPFLSGETYAYVPAQLIPRFIWLDKPQAHVATSALSIYYGLQTDETVKNATIGFGMLAESYANFGFIGVGCFAFIMGGFYKWVSSITAESPLLSYPGLFLIILTAWSFQAEATAAIWIGSMFQACAGVLGVPFLLRNFLG